MASEKDKQELVTKVTKLVNTKFEGDFHRAFLWYDKSIDQRPDGKLNKDELKRLLEDADVGNGFTRGVWAKEIIKAMDTDKDGAISWEEFQAMLKQSK